jgi:predicted nucleic acid-binding protein
VTQLLVDNSVIQRINRSIEVAAALRDLVRGGDQLCYALPTLLDAGYSARSRADHAMVIEQLTRGGPLLSAGNAAEHIALALQRALFAAGKGRAAGVVGLLLAATAVEHDAVVLHYDSDFEELAAVDARVRARWVVPRGSVA